MILSHLRSQCEGAHLTWPYRMQALSSGTGQNGSKMRTERGSARLHVCESTARRASTLRKRTFMKLAVSRPDLAASDLVTHFKVYRPFTCRKRQRIACRASIVEKVEDALEGESMDEWTSCVQKIESLGLEETDAEQVVGQAFGWGKQAYWLNKKKNEVPDLSQVEAVLAYLEEDLELKGDDLKKVVKSFPEVINCSVEKRLKANIEHMQKAYYMKGPAAKNTVKRQPAVLGYTVDCQGSCEGLCNQCWVRL